MSISIPLLRTAALPLLAMTALLAAAPCASGAIIGTYVDAGHVNTTGMIVDGNGQPGDNSWHLRTDSSKNWEANTILECDDNTVTPGDLTTSITGLAAGTYNVYMVYWTNSGTGWFVSASLNDGDFATYDKTTGVATGIYAPNSTVVYEREVLLGQVTVAANGGFSVTVQGHTTSQSTERSWYEGVAYEAVPEPASLALLGLGGLLARRRRRG